MLVDFLVANTTREEGRNIAITARGGRGGATGQDKMICGLF